MLLGRARTQGEISLLCLSSGRADHREDHNQPRGKRCPGQTDLHDCLREELREGLHGDMAAYGQLADLEPQQKGRVTRNLGPGTSGKSLLSGNLRFTA